MPKVYRFTNFACPKPLTPARACATIARMDTITFAEFGRAVAVVAALMLLRLGFAPNDLAILAAPAAAGQTPTNLDGVYHLAA